MSEVHEMLDKEGKVIFKRYLDNYQEVKFYIYFKVTYHFPSKK